jgi:phosphatidylethanolamine/phosphatidyl-N-methylethanolamine N-methyltransferase
MFPKRPHAVNVRTVSRPPSPVTDSLRFLRALIARPKNIGAILPSGPALAQAIDRQIGDPDAGPVLELGPGTGAITQAILGHGVPPARLTTVEFDPDMAAELAGRYPGIRVIEGDAFDLDRTLGPLAKAPYAAIISGLPLLNFPLDRRHAYMEGLTRNLVPGGPIIQFSYGTHAPVPAPPGFSVTRAALVWANIPPARVWVYRQR